jgi:hypothetical protein
MRGSRRGVGVAFRAVIRGGRNEDGRAVLPWWETGDHLPDLRDSHLFVSADTRSARSRERILAPSPQAANDAGGTAQVTPPIEIPRTGNQNNTASGFDIQHTRTGYGAHDDRLRHVFIFCSFFPPFIGLGLQIRLFLFGISTSLYAFNFRRLFCFLDGYGRYLGWVWERDREPN